MAQEKPNRLVEFVLLLRKQGSVLRQHVVEWLAAIQENPRLLWEAAGIRYFTYLVGGVMLAWGASVIAHSLAPPLPPGAKQLATTADFHVLCSRPECGEHFIINRSFGFRSFPVPCAKCQQTTGNLARQCNSEKCHGRWVRPTPDETGSTCPMCAQPFDN